MIDDSLHPETQGGLVAPTAEAANFYAIREVTGSIASVTLRVSVVRELTM